MSGEDFGSPFGGTDPMREMRERINRDREAFFGDDIGGPRRMRWPQESPFFRDPAGLYEFPSPTSPGGFRTRFNMPGFPPEDDFARTNSFDQHHGGPANHHAPADAADKPIPIRVVHERTGVSPQTPKNHLKASSRNTTEIPTSARTNATESNNIQLEKSPRLERAHSEPPKLFNQRIRAGGASSPGGAPQQAYTTIPENSEPVMGGGSPRFATTPRADSEMPASTPNHKLSSSASAPSVPATSQNRPSSTGTPVAPPRRATLQQQQQQQEALNREREAAEKQQQQQQQQHAEAPKVRHIPIFVEGRDEPVTQRKTSQTDIGGGGFRQPSEFYPQNVQKVRSQSVSSPGPSGGSGLGGGGFVRAGGLNLKPMQPQQQPPQEPTSPLSPIPSDQPIPMGCSGDYFVKTEAAPKPEPTSPAPLPPGPIPMPYTATTVDGPAPEVVHHVPVKVIETPDPSPQKPEQSKPTDVELSPAEAKLRKIESEVAELLQRVEKFSGGKRDKEYLFLDDLLTQKLCLLDSIESDGREDIRKMRKDSIKNITRCLSILDRRATASATAGSPAGVTQAEASDDAAHVSNQVLSELASVSISESKGEPEEPKKE